MAKCDGPNCDAEIVWAETPAGKEQPFDREPSEKGNRILLGRGPNRKPLALSSNLLVTDENLDGALYEGVLYVPHHATCPDRERFSK